ncbi:MAG: response regulator [Deltaproteobacteria bacterium]|nr:response regulator [Deltaproteobacteria bacterium]
MAEFKKLDPVEIVFMSFLNEDRFGRDETGWQFDLLLGNIWDEILHICNTAIRLEDLGYEVITEGDPIKALGIFKEKPEAFDLVITDMTMPNMTGDRLAKEIMEIRSDMPVILCTGFSELISEEQAKEMGIKAFVMKPALVHEMAATIRQVLDQEAISLVHT